MAGERALQLAELGKIAGIDRKAGSLPQMPASIAATSGSGSPAAPPAAIKENWAVRVWNMLSAGASAMAAAAHWLIG